jgi:hypothetical protein
MSDIITIKNPKTTNTIHLLNILKILEDMNKNLLLIGNEVAYIKKKIKELEDKDDIKTEPLKTGWFY